MISGVYAVMMAILGVYGSTDACVEAMVTGVYDGNGRCI